jgi:predicted nucleotidyltransferase
MIKQPKQGVGMKAIFLGGSCASGNQNEGSDLDIGPYYPEDKPFSLEKIRLIA